MSDDDPVWFYANGDERKGPVSRVQMRGLLAGGVVRAQTLVWTAGMPGWSPMAQTGLRDLLGENSEPLAPPGLPNEAIEPAGPAPGRDFVEAIRVCLARYAQFRGRASRSEFWYFYLFVTLVSTAAWFVDTAILQRGGGAGVLQGIVFLAAVVPSLAVTVRRLHDTDRTGWWWWFWLVPLIGTIVLLVLLCQRATPGRNRFG